MVDRDTAYSDGYEDGSSGATNDNPYNPNEERELFDEYEKGYFEGIDSVGD